MKGGVLKTIDPVDRFNERYGFRELVRKFINAHEEIIKPVYEGCRAISKLMIRDSKLELGAEKKEQEAYSFSEFKKDVAVVLITELYYKTKEAGEVDAAVEEALIKAIKKAMDSSEPGTEIMSLHRDLYNAAIDTSRTLVNTVYDSINERLEEKRADDPSICYTETGS